MGVDTLVRPTVVHNQGSSVRAMLDGPETSELASSPDTAISFEDALPLPTPDDPYIAHARASNKALPTLRLVMADASINGLSYMNLEKINFAPADSPGAGMAIVLRFAGSETTLVKLEGRNLTVLYDKIGYHRVSWIREIGRGHDFADPKATVVTEIKVEVVEA